MQRGTDVEYDTPPSEILTGQNVKSSGGVFVQEVVLFLWYLGYGDVADAWMIWFCLSRIVAPAKVAFLILF